MENKDSFIPVEKRTSSDICEVIIRRYGNIQAACRELGVSYMTIYRYAEQSKEIQEAIDYGRANKPRLKLEKAELVYEMAMNDFIEHGVDKREAINVAHKIIDKLGYIDAYRDSKITSDPAQEQQESIKPQLDALLSFVGAKQAEVASERKIALSNINTDVKSE